MVLDSQLARNGSRQRHMAARRRGGPLWSWLGLAALIIVVAGGVVWFWYGMADLTDDTGTSAPVDVGAADTVTPSDVPPPEGAVDVPPVVADEQTGPSEVEPPVDAGLAGDVEGDAPATHLADASQTPPSDVTDEPGTEGNSETPGDAQADTPPPIETEDANADDATGTSIDAPPAGALDETLRKIKESRTDVQTREMINRLLADASPRLSAADRKLIRQVLTRINEKLVYSRTVQRGDPLTELYTIQSGDALSRIARRFKIDYRCLAQINGVDPDRIFAGRKLKVIHGPFHAVVDKSDFRLDLYLVDPTGERMYINSLPVGLGEDGSTPAGKWIVRPRAKVINPQYVDPRTGKVYAPDDPQNPVGEHWIGLEGMEEGTAELHGYGIHGTIEPQSIGRQVSMGCIRLGAQDIATLYGLLVEGESTVVVKE